MNAWGQVESAFKHWFDRCRTLLDKEVSGDRALPDLPTEELLDRLRDAAVEALRTGEDPEPEIERLAAVCRDHNRRVAVELGDYEEVRQGVTVERIGLLRKAHLGEAETGLLEILFKVKISRVLSRLRAEQDLSLRDLERRSGVSASYVSQIERGVSGFPSPQILTKLDAAWGLGDGSGPSLLKLLDDYETRVRAVQREGARVTGALVRLLGRDPEQKAEPPDLMLSGAVSMSPATRPEGTGFASPGRRLAGVQRARPVDPWFSEPGVRDESVGDPAVQLLYTYFRRLSPELQQAVLRLVRDLVRAQGAGRQEPLEGSEDEEQE